MCSETDLNSKIMRLEAESDIEKLRYRYWFAILDKDVATLVDCFAEDAFLEYGFDIELHGVEAIKPFFDRVLLSDDLKLQIPRGSNGLLTIENETQANGRWLVQVIALRNSDNVGSRINVQYFERYEKINGEWKIKKMKNDYLSFENIEPRDGP